MRKRVLTRASVAIDGSPDHWDCSGHVECVGHVKIAHSSARCPGSRHRLPDHGGPHPARPALTDASGSTRRPPPPSPSRAAASPTDSAARSCCAATTSPARPSSRRTTDCPSPPSPTPKKSATALRALGGGNTVRFLLSWAHAEPVRGQVDTAYLAAATAQMRRLPRRRHPRLPRLPPGPLLPLPVQQGQLVHRRRRPQVGRRRWAAIPTESCGICLVLGPEHHPERGREEGDVRLLAQHASAASRTPSSPPPRRP